MPSASPVSSQFMPPKKRHSTSFAWRVERGKFLEGFVDDEHILIFVCRKQVFVDQDTGRFPAAWKRRSSPESAALRSRRPPGSGCGSSNLYGSGRSA
jgi:hypothetical protein